MKDKKKNQNLMREIKPKGASGFIAAACSVRYRFEGQQDNEGCEWKVLSVYSSAEVAWEEMGDWRVTGMTGMQDFRVVRVTEEILMLKQNQKSEHR